MSLSPGPRRIGILFLLYFAIWGMTSFPAVTQAWWSTDDYDFALDYRWWHNYGHGRPLANLVMGTLPWDTGTYGDAVNVGLRLLQGAVHTGVALLAALLLFQRTRSRAALVAATVFLLWSYNGEAVLWRSAGSIPVSALLSVAGALLVSAGTEKRRWPLAVAGMLLVATAVLFQQLGAMAGLVLWGMVLVVQTRPASLRDVGGALWLGGGYVVGALLSRVTARWLLGDLPGRDQLTTDLWGKVDYLLQLWRDVLWPSFSPAQGYFQMALLGLMVVALAVHLIRVDESVLAKLLRAAAALSLLVLPFAPVLLSSASPTAARILYLGPLLLVAACLAIALLLEQVLHTTSAGIVLTGALVVVYLPMAALNAADYPAIHTADVRVLKELQSRILEMEPQPPAGLVVADLTQYLRAYDPHEVVRVFNSESKLSAFMLPWSSEALIEWRSDLEPRMETEPIRLCSTACTAAAEASGEKKPFLILPLEENHTYCLCP